MLPVLGFCSLSASSDALQMFHTISLKYVVLINLLIVFVLMLIIYMFN